MYLSYFWREIINYFHADFDTNLVVNHLSRVGKEVKISKDKNINIHYDNRHYDKRDYGEYPFSLCFWKKFLLQVKKTSKGNLIVKVIRVPIFNKMFLKNFFRRT